MKKSIALLLSVLMLLGTMVLAPVTAQAAQSDEEIAAQVEDGSADDADVELGAEYTSNGYKYTVRNGEAIVNGTTNNYASVNIPSSLGGYPVRVINYSAFKGNTVMTSLTLPNSLRLIDNSAFRECPKLKTVNLGTSVKTIGSSAFDECVALTSITIPNSVTEIGSYCFYSCSNLTSASIGNGVTKMGGEVFGYCKALKSVSFAPGATIVGSSMFRYCELLSSVKLPDSITTIENHAFSYCKSVSAFSIPPKVKEIKNDTFYGCSNLSKTNIGDNVVSIGERAYCQCIRLAVLTIPDSVRKIDASAFSFCEGMTTLYVGSGVREMGKDAFQYTTSLTKATIANGCTVIGENAFYGSKKLNTIVIPASVNQIGTVNSANADPKDTDVFYYHNAGLIIYGSSGSFAQKFARATGIPFSVGNPPVPGAPLTKVVISSLKYNIGSNTITWNPVPGATGYQVARKKTGDKSYYYYNTSNNYWSNHSVSSGYSYVYQVRAYNGSTYGPWSASSSIVTMSVPNLTVSLKSNGIRTEWGTISGAKKYVVYYKKYGSSSWSSVTTTNRYYPFLNLQLGSYYYFQVQPVGVVNGPYSAVSGLQYVKITNEKPVVTLSNKTNGIRAEWKPVKWANSYIVYYRRAEAKTWQYQTTTNTYFAYLNAVKDSTYCFQVQAVFSGVKGAYSDVKAQTFSPVNNIKPSVQLSNRSSYIRASWGAVKDATAYIVYYKKASSKTWSSAVTTNLYYQCTGTQSGTAYSFQVRPIFYGTGGAYSDVKTITYYPT